MKETIMNIVGVCVVILIFVVVGLIGSIKEKNEIKNEIVDKMMFQQNDETGLCFGVIDEPQKFAIERIDCKDMPNEPES